MLYPYPCPQPGVFCEGIPVPRVFCHGRTELIEVPDTGKLEQVPVRVIAAKIPRGCSARTLQKKLARLILQCAAVTCSMQLFEGMTGD